MKNPPALQIASDVSASIAEAMRGRLYAGMQLLRGRKLTHFLRELQSIERLTAAELQRLSQERLLAILEYARSHVPLCQSNEWNIRLAGQHERIENWPVIDKQLLLTNFDDMLATPSPPKIVFVRTSGSTGKAAKIAMTYDSDTLGWAHRYRGLMWHGIPVAVRSLRMSHDRRPFRNLVMGQVSTPALDTDEAIDNACKLISKWRPRMIAGPPSTLFYIARFLREKGATEASIPFARVGGEQLFAFQRAEIETYLASRAINAYGVTEFGALAGECPRGSMHVYTDHAHVEILKGDSPVAVGELGDIVVTGLQNFAMPLIRYRVGDRGRLGAETCSCGLPYPVLSDLRARADDVLVDSAGNHHHGSELVERMGHCFADPLFEGFRQVQFVQANRHSWKISVEASDAVRTEQTKAGEPLPSLERLTEIVREVFGMDCHVEAAFVDHISRAKGKLRYYRRAD